MRMSRLLMVSCLYCTLLGCSSMNTVHPAHQKTQQVAAATPMASQYHKNKNPMEVSLYPSGKSLSNPYTIIGEASISEYNMVGIKRQNAIIHDAMRTLAAAMGGDAIIDVKHLNNAVIGKVIAYPSKAIA